MKRIYKGNDLVFNLSVNNIPINMSLIKTIEFKFYTLNPANYIKKTEASVDKDNQIILEWQELEKLEQGVLYYDYKMSLFDDTMIDSTLDHVEKVMTDYYIVTGKDAMDISYESAKWGKIQGDINLQLDLVDYININSAGKKSTETREQSVCTVTECADKTNQAVLSMLRLLSKESNEEITEHLNNLPWTIYPYDGEFGILQPPLEAFISSLEQNGVKITFTKTTINKHGEVFGDYYHNKALGNNSAAFGDGTVAQSYGEFVAGKFNALNPDAHEGRNHEEDDNLFVIGCGSNGNNRCDVVTIKGGNGYGNVWIKDIGGYNGKDPFIAQDLATVVNGKLDTDKLSTKLKTINGESLVGNDNVETIGKKYINEDGTEGGEVFNGEIKVHTVTIKPNHSFSFMFNTQEVQPLVKDGINLIQGIQFCEAAWILYSFFKLIINPSNPTQIPFKLVTRADGRVYNNTVTPPNILTISKGKYNVDGIETDFLQMDRSEYYDNDDISFEITNMSKQTITLVIPNNPNDANIIESYNIAESIYSHSEGHKSIASGLASHTEGVGTITSNNGEHAEGKYNVSNSNTISSIGIGINEIFRMNAVEVLNKGEIYVKGIGNFTGVYNPNNQYQQSLQAVIKSLTDRISALEAKK